jgi:hypothetical protein
VPQRVGEPSLNLTSHPLYLELFKARMGILDNEEADMLAKVAGSSTSVQSPKLWTQKAMLILS